MDYQYHTQDKIITRYSSCIKAKQAHNYNHFKVAILHKEKQSAYMPCQYHLSPWLELLSTQCFYNEIYIEDSKANLFSIFWDLV